MSKLNKTNGNKAVEIYWMVAILSVFFLMQNIAQADDLDQQLMEIAKIGDLNQVKALIKQIERTFVAKSDG